MKKIYVSLFLSAIIFFLNSPIFSQNPGCANFSGVFISDSLEQNKTEYVVCNGSNIYLKSLTNPSGATFQWKKNGVNISGEITRKLNATSSGIYSLTMTLGSCTATSSGLLVQFSDGYIPISVYYDVTQACVGDSITLQVGRKDFTYQWKKDGVNVSGANQYYYKATTTGTYTVSVSQGTCSDTYPFPIALSFNNTVLPVISTNKTIVCEGKTTVLKTSKINPAYTLQWLKDGVAISGANKDSLVVNRTGNYRLQTSGGTCNGNSNSLNISITNLNLPAPQIENFNVYNYRYNNSFETCANNVVKLKVKDYNDTTVVWLKDGNVIAGQTGTTLLARESGNYAVRYSGNELCFAQSALVPVKITDVATMSFAGNDAVVKTGESATIKYTFTGVSPIYLKINNTYENLIVNPITQRYFEDIYSTKTFSATTIANACGVGTFSNPTTKTVGNYPQTTGFTLSTSYVTVCIGGSTTLTGSAYGSGSPFTYQWQRDGVDFAGANQSSLNISNFTYADIGYYRVKAVGTYGSAISDEIQVNANYGDVVFAKLDYPAYTNSDILLTAFSGSSFGNASNAYRWAGPNGFTSTEQNPVIPNGTALNSGTYTVTATNAGGCVNYALLSVTVTTAPITLGNLGTTSFCPNGTLSVPFTTTLAIGTLYKVYLSDANGSFIYQSEIGDGMTSPITVTFPQYGVYAGTRYRIKIVSTSPSATSSLSEYLSTDGQVLTISVKNLIDRVIGSYTTICDGSALTGIISANQSEVTYEWKKDGVSQNMTNTLKMIGSGNYNAYVQKSGCSKINTSLVITFSNSSVNYLYSQGSGYQCLGDSMLLTDTYYSDSATYQWKKDGNIILGQSQIKMIAKITGVYSSTVIDKCPVTTNNGNANIIFSNVIENNPLYLTSSKKQALCGDNDNVTLFGSVPNYNINPLTSYSYQWKKNGIDILNANNPILFINSSGVYSLTLFQGNCSSVSEGFKVTKVDTVKLDFRIANPYKEEICQGMSTLVEGRLPNGTNGQFYKDGSLIRNFYSFQFQEFISETGKYVISGTSPGCVILPSDTVKISVGNRLKSKIGSSDITLCNGSSSGFYSWGLYPYSPSPTFQWFKNDIPVPSQNQTSITVYQSGFYKLRITSGGCTGFSDSLEFKTVSQFDKPNFYNRISKIFDPVNDGQICVNGIVPLFYSSSNSFENVVIYDSVQLKRNGLFVSWGKGNNAFAISQSGTYTIIGKQGTCTSLESDPVEIKIGEPITANITGSTSIYPGQKAKLNLNFTGGNAWSYQTSDVATGQTTSLSPTLKNVSPASTQTYAITSVASNCGVGTVTGDATITVLPCPTDKTISINSGNWNTATTWTCGQIPTAAYDAIIENGHTVTLPNGYQGITKKLDLRGGLRQGVGTGVRIGN
jgi:hypothetical protein